MDERHHLAESRQIEAQAHELAEMIDRAVELMRVLTALRLRWETLQAAASEFVAAAGQRSPATPALAPSMSAAGVAVHTGRPPELVPARHPRPAPFIPANGPSAGPPDYSEDPGRDETGEANRAGVVQTAPPRPITLTIESHDGPLDLGRIYAALESVPGVVGVALVTYARGQAALRVHSDRPVEELSLEESLRGVLEGGLSATWTAPDELAVSLTPPD